MACHSEGTGPTRNASSPFWNVRPSKDALPHPTSTIAEKASAAERDQGMA
jgi:hypothetical protein